MNKTAIIVTTIHVPTFLTGLCRNAICHNQRDISILVIGDRKTPTGARTLCNLASWEYGIDIEYMDIADQEGALSQYPDLLGIIPANTPDRIILGGMIAYLRGCDRLIAVDDDNYVTDHDFVGYHSITGTEVELELVESESGWFNVHETLNEQHNMPFYPRGFPWGQRTPELGRRTWQIKEVRVVVNQGLVLGDPDIDAISRLFWPIRATGMHDRYGPQFGLSPGTWAPFNYQNTSLCREIIPLYYRPSSTLRNADIWTAYVITRLAEHFGDVIAYGQPLVRQVRNPHNLWDDLDAELLNNRATDRFVSILRKVSLSKETYLEALGELLEGCRRELVGVQWVPKTEKEMIDQFFIEYERWHGIVSRICE